MTLCGFCVQAGETVKGAAVGAKDAVMNTIGMGGGTNGSTDVTAKDTSTYKPGTRDY